MDKYTEMPDNIKSREDFIKFMRHFIPTVNDASLKNYLEALTAWTEDMDGYYRNFGKEMPENINWEIIAAMLYAGYIYE